MHTSVKNVNASKSSKKSRTQTTISKFFTSANDKSQPTDQPGIKRLDGRHEGRGKVRALYAGQAQFVYTVKTALLSYYRVISTVQVKYASHARSNTDWNLNLCYFRRGYLMEGCPQRNGPNSLTVCRRRREMRSAWRPPALVRTHAPCMPFICFCCFQLVYLICLFIIGSINEAGTNTFLNLFSLQRVNNKKGVYEINVSFGVHTKRGSTIMFFWCFSEL